MQAKSPLAIGTFSGSHAINWNEFTQRVDHHSNAIEAKLHGRFMFYGDLFSVNLSNGTQTCSACGNTFKCVNCLSCVLMEMHATLEIIKRRTEQH